MLQPGSGKWTPDAREAWEGEEQKVNTNWDKLKERSKFQEM